MLVPVHQVVPGSEGHQVCVVGGGWDGHRPGTAHVGVAQLVGEGLQLISCEVVLIPQHVVVRGTGCALTNKQNFQNRNFILQWLECKDCIHSNLSHDKSGTQR